MPDLYVTVLAAASIVLLAAFGIFLILFHHDEDKVVAALRSINSERRGLDGEYRRGRWWRLTCLLLPLAGYAVIIGAGAFELTWFIPSDGVRGVIVLFMVVGGFDVLTSLIRGHR